MTFHRPDQEPDPDAPTDIRKLPDYWDARRLIEGKPDKSRCAADLRRALEARSGPGAMTSRNRLEDQLRHAQRVLDAAKDAVAMAQAHYHECWMRLQEAKRKPGALKLVKESE